MKHIREDYNRIQDPAGLIPEDEPVMLFRGQDKVAPVALHAYANIAEAMGAAPELVASVRAQAAKMNEWQASEKSKIPDIPVNTEEPETEEKTPPPPLPSPEESDAS